MTQHPADPLVDAIAKALYEDEHACDSSRKGRTWEFGKDAMGHTYRIKAQAALAAVREGHVVVPSSMLKEAIGHVQDAAYERESHQERGEIMELADKLESLTQHDGAKDAE